MPVIEITGLVLGAFPLAIEALKAYGNGIKTIKDIVRYRQVLDLFELEISVELFFFRETLEGLLEEDLPPDDIQQLMSEPGGELWKSLGVQASLEKWIRRGDGVTLFLQVAEHLDRTLREVAAKFAQPAVKKSIFHRARLAWDTGMLSDYRKETINRLQMLNGQLRQFISSQNGANANMMIDNTPENVSQSICTKAVQQYRRIRVHAKTVYQLLDEYLLPPVCDCPSTHYACLQLEVRVNGQSSSLNLGGRQSEVFLNMMISAKDLRKAPSICTELLLEGVESRASFKPQTQNLVIPASTEPPQPVQDPAGAGQKPVVKISIGSHIRASAKKFIPSIFPKGKSRIHESVVPDSTVTLKPTLIPPRKPKKIVSFSQPNRGDDINSSPHHNSALADRLGYKHLEVDGATLKRIDSLCSAINISPGNSHLSHCLGILSPNTDTTIQTRAWIPSPNPLLLGLVKVVSLESLISSNSLPKPPLKSRIALAVTLASSVMQLHSTAWLNDLWSISDIWFLKQDTSIELILERPLIYKPFSHSKITEVSIPTITQNSVWRVLAPNKDLLSLGIALIELLEWRSFESIQNDKSYNLLLEPSVDIKLNRYLAAKQMVDYLKKQCRDNDLYFNSLRRCIEGLDHAGKTLDRDDFKKQVYRLIVRPLEVHLRQGWGC